MVVASDEGGKFWGWGVMLWRVMRVMGVQSDGRSGNKFTSPKFTNRQRVYARTRSKGSIVLRSCCGACWSTGSRCCCEGRKRSRWDRVRSWKGHGFKKVTAKLACHILINVLKLHLKSRRNIHEILAKST